MSHKRERIEIIHDILQSIQTKRDNVKPTHILYKSNLSHQMLKDYLSELIAKNFIIEAQDKKGNKRYSLTDKGFNYLKDFGTIRSFLESYDLG
jgi:predicted transcriptional regulator